MIHRAVCTLWEDDGGATYASIDRTGELRKLGFEGRRLGTEQMTTDTAARVARIVVLDKSTFG